MVAVIADNCDILCLPIGQEINSICQGSGPRERSECRGWGGQALEGLSYLPKVRRVRGACANGCLNYDSLEPLTLAFTLLMLRDSGPQPGRSQPF